MNLEKTTSNPTLNELEEFFKEESPVLPFTQFGQTEPTNLNKEEEEIDLIIK